MKTTSSLVLTTYNWPEALDLVLKSIVNLKILPSEVIIADDGSKKETLNLIESYRERLKVPLIHIWQEDEGFQKSKILNKAIAKANGEYIIQIDGDCILHPYFIKDHLALANKNTYLFGSRVNILEHHLEHLFKHKQVSFSPFSKGIKNRTRALHCSVLSNLYRSRDSLSKKLRGCNISFFKKDFIKVNGYNEDFKGWGREDSELALRFHNNGIKGRRIRYRGIVFHIHHNIRSKVNLDHNDDIEELTVKQKILRCNNGVDQYLE